VVQLGIEKKSRPVQVNVAAAESRGGSGKKENLGEVKGVHLISGERGNSMGV